MQQVSTTVHSKQAGVTFNKMAVPEAKYSTQV